ncbi:hypothetical protein [Haloferax sp. DFSO52]|uniref:hypothetical protein n=1 Tax=Haloferax sp. DFSO52 TaxID=3388505 RepID=UPI003A84EC2C
MPSRRMFLRTLAGVTGVGMITTAGCIGRIQLPEEGVLTYKSVHVGWRYEERMRWADLCWVWSDGERRIFGWYPEEYPEVVPSSSVVVATDELERRLNRDFDGLEYRLGFTRPNRTGGELRSTDWFVALASRHDFNSVQFGDVATVAFDTSHVSVSHVRKDAVGPVDDWEQLVRPMDFSETFASAGVPIT